MNLGRSIRLKRLIDIAGAALALVVAAIPMVAVALATRLTAGRPVLFRQVRPGLHGTPFTILKFRTMRVAGSLDDRSVPDEHRLTRLGRFLRSTSLDELPELYNVLRGDMSLVGPRPLLMEYLERYDPEQARRHDLRPGMTGLAQVAGRNELPWDERLALDVWYVDNWTIALDLKIVARTIECLLRRRGVSYPGHATMPDFRGGPDFPH